ncbi:MAG: hypothetical protein KIT14_10280 [bacterium]|nr:hypothetical protein [bacterium]
MWLRRCTVAAVLILLAGAAGVALPRGAKPRVCDPGRFLLPAGSSALVTGGPTVAADAVVLLEATGRRLVSIESGCAPARARTRATRQGTRLRIRWPACHQDRKVRLAALIAPDCVTMRGTLKAVRTPRRAFEASRSICGDARVDPVVGEECDGDLACPDGMSCVACRCTETSATTIPTTTTPPVTTTSSSTTLPPAGTTTSTAPTPTTTTVTTTSTTATTSSSTTTTLPGTPPPDPAAVAPAPTPGEIGAFAKGTTFLHTSGIQIGADPTAFDARRTALVRGRVLDASGAPLAAVTISVLDHPELGHTLTRDDGRFDLAVNGGGSLVLRYEKADRIPAQRSVEVPWNDWALAPDVVLLAASPTVTAIDAEAAGTQEAAGDVVADDSGTRQPILIVPPGTKAELVRPDGSVEPLASFHVRMTEFTVGALGPQAMPAALPPASGYTYAVEFSVDEAAAAGAREVRFDRPLVHYLENFLDFPVGSVVPAGAYDRTRGTWAGAPNGRVVRIVGTAGGLAQLDIDGDGVADDASGLGVGDGERARLAARYAPGQTLWRVPIAHFSPWDCNWPYGPPPDGPPPRNPPPRNDPPPKGDDPCKQNGSVIECQTQILGEDVPVAGTSLRLHYRSNRVVGRAAMRALVIPVTPAAVPAPLKRATVTVTIAGQQHEKTFPPGPDQAWTFVWNGRDAWGRPLQGRQAAHVRIAWVYDAFYLPPADFQSAFAQIAADATPITGDRARSEITLYQDWDAMVGGLDARILGLGGWTLGVQHAFDLRDRLYLGDGTTRSGETFVHTVKSLSGPGIGTPQQQADLSALHGIASAPDGSLYVLAGCRLRRLAPNGAVEHVAGHPSGCGVATGFEEGIQASTASLGVSRGMAIGPDGRTIYIAEAGRHRIRRIGPDGVIRTIAGTGTAGFDGDGGPAIDARFNEPWGIAAAADGSLYVADALNNRIRRIGPEGHVATFAGTGSAGNPAGDGGSARLAVVSLPQSVAVAPDGTVYVAQRGRVRAIDAAGVITSVPGVGTLSNLDTFPTALAVAIGPGGHLYVSEAQRVRHVLPDGSIDEVFGSGANTFCPTPSGCGENGPARAAGAFLLRYLAVTPDGRVAFVDETNDRTRTVQPSLPAFVGSGLVIPSADGGEAYRFDGDGRHLETYDALTGAVRWQLGYDAAGHLATLTDGDGNVVTVERDAAGAATAIVAPGGQRTALALDADGYLASVSAPGGRTWHFAYGPNGDGLLTRMTDPRGAVHHYGYDDLGYLISDARPGAGTTTLARVDTAGGSTVTLTTGDGLVSTFAVETLADGVVRRHATEPSGATTESLVRPDGTQRVTHADGTVVDLVEGPDPRWSMQAPLVRSVTMKLPGEAGATRTFDRTVTLAQPSLALLTQTDTITVGGTTATVAWNTAARTFTVTSPAGHQEVVTVDAQRRVIGRAMPGIAPVSYTYDARGRLERAAHGPMQLAFTWDAANRLTARTDALGDRVALGYDAAGRQASATLPSGRTWMLAWNATDLLTHVTPPGTAAHVLAYDAAGRETAYTPPGGTPWAFTRTLDGAADTVALPDGRGEQLILDAGGRATGLVWNEAAVSVSYVGVTSRPDIVTRTAAGGGAPQALDRDWNGRLPIAARFIGPATGAFTWEHDARFRVRRTRLASGLDTIEVARSYDADGRVASIGSFTVTRAGPDGLPTSISDGIGTITYAYDALGRLAARTHVVNGIAVYAVALEFDAAGRIATRIETDAGGPHVEAYTFDPDGQLLEVVRDGVVAQRYEYDDRANRTGRRLGAGATQVAAYDAQDRLLSRAAVGYVLGAAGFLVERGADVFTYSAAGELLAATAGGESVTYGYDGLRRRTTRTGAGGTSQYLYGNRDDDLELTAVRDSSGVLTWHHYDDGGRLIALDRGGTRYYVATDQLGSPRVVASADGTVVRKQRWDAFGVLAEDSAPGFALATGFAGGLSDPVTGLVRFGLRDYEPASGRFTSRDPALFDGRQGNLYAYAGNDPVNRVDRTGLTSVEVSAYEVIGVDAKLALTPDGLSACFGLGFGGGGGSVALDPFGDLDDNKVALDAKVKGQLGGVKAELGGEVSECRKTKFKGEGCVGPLCSKLDKTLDKQFNGQLKAKPEEFREGLDGLLGKFKDTGMGLKLKVGAKICQQVRW